MISFAADDYTGPTQSDRSVQQGDVSPRQSAAIDADAPMGVTSQEWGFVLLTASTALALPVVSHEVGDTEPGVSEG